MAIWRRWRSSRWRSCTGTAGATTRQSTLYQELMKKPTTTVPAGLAQLALADMYQVEGKTDLAKKELADLKDKDPKGPAGAAGGAETEPGSGWCGWAAAAVGIAV